MGFLLMLKILSMKVLTNFYLFAPLVFYAYLTKKMTNMLNGNVGLSFTNTFSLPSFGVCVFLGADYPNSSFKF